MRTPETWILPAGSWHECILEGLPYAARPGDAVRVVAPSAAAAIAHEVSAPVLVAPHLLPPRHVLRLPRGCAVYQTENTLARPMPLPTDLRARTYSRALARATGAEYWPLVPRLDLTAAVAPARPGHVLFVGSLNARRQRLLSDIQRRGVPIVTYVPPERCFGTRLQVELRRATLVLNCHYYLPGIFEAFRVVPAISAGAPVVSELCEDNEGAEHSQVGGGITWAPYENLAATVEKLFSLLTQRRPVLHGNADDRNAD